MSAGAAPQTAGVVLAAGASRRFGMPKQLVEFGGRPLLLHAVDAAVAAGLPDVVVVIGHRAADIAARVHLPRGARYVVNTRYRQGQGTSLRVGLDVLGREVTHAVVLLGDQPTVAAAHIAAALRLARESGAPVVRTRYRGRPGHPVVLHRRVWDAVVTPGVDAGARLVLDAHPEWVATLDLDLPPPIDVDTAEDLAALREQGWAGSRPAAPPEQGWSAGGPAALREQG